MSNERQACFVKVPVAIICDKRLQGAPVRIWMYLAHVQGQNENSWRSVETIATALHLSKSAVDRGLHKLADYGLISRKRRFNNSSVSTCLPLSVIYGDDLFNPNPELKNVHQPEQSEDFLHSVENISNLNPPALQEPIETQEDVHIALNLPANLTTIETTEVVTQPVQTVAQSSTLPEWKHPIDEQKTYQRASKPQTVGQVSIACPKPTTEPIKPSQPAGFVVEPQPTKRTTPGISENTKMTRPVVVDKRDIMCLEAAERMLVDHAKRSNLNLDRLTTGLYRAWPNRKNSFNIPGLVQQAIELAYPKQ